MGVRYLFPHANLALATLIVSIVFWLCPLSSLKTAQTHNVEHVASAARELSELPHETKLLGRSHLDVARLETLDGGKNVSVSSHHIRRAPPVGGFTYDYAVCKGGLLWTKIQAAFNGETPAGPKFERQDFSSAWSLSPGKDQGQLKTRWEAAFKSFANANNQFPIGDQVSSLKALQDKTFLSSAGYPVNTPTGAEYTLQYIPFWSAMLATFVNSPSNRLTDSFSNPYGHPINPNDVASLIPPLNRLSDMSWYIYGLIGNPSKIRYIGHDWINNADTINVMEDIFMFHTGAADPEIPWPGLDFDIASQDGRALLATPNSLGIAYLMIDHAADLGRRRPRVHIFGDDGGHLCMLWDLAPVG
ncbi:MAG: hypothetical protein Q9168_004531 [Polycauliona sp. 1 TL-2023]